MTNQLAEIRYRLQRVHMWNAPEDIRLLLAMLDEAVNHIEAMLIAGDVCDRMCETICQAHGGCDNCDVARAREFVERVRGTE